MITLINGSIWSLSAKDFRLQFLVDTLPLESRFVDPRPGSFSVANQTDTGPDPEP